ncbi:AMIN-like domain-containing (lipo)protein [Jiangella alkaliphila]|uniref:AMIN-like domain-containing protein n=1 Tax=Jiangella alkaliphila TaxID=419479 RepID=A0A1H2M547_9ACTN|nr:hypothetical protein [Jiangella alkaliphila]SDU88390.1 hypothetical protein SAMN04488563_7089 [Jiangella alkaliphila]
MKRTITMLTALLTAGLAFLAAPAAADAGPYCGLRWGSLPERAAVTQTAPLTDVRAGRHACFDRLVLDFAGDADGYSVRYVSSVSMDGSGQLVPLRGAADLEVVAVAPAHDAGGHATYTPAVRAELVRVTGWRTFRQVAWAGSFEGQTTIGLGVRARLPFRVFTLDGPGAGSRLVVDVAHRW